MDVTAIIAPLNDAQREAVTTETRSTLVLAGAGSGKTRVLVHRIAWLLRVAGASPGSILAVTFTNKAAGEMRARIEPLLGGPQGSAIGGVWSGTFHAVAHRLLRMHWREADLPQTFQILDSDDQLRVIKKVLKALDLDDSRYPPKQVAWFINSNKDEGRRPGALAQGDPAQRQMLRLYEEYEKHCARSGVVDFAELLLRTVETLARNAALLAHYQRRFAHLLVDEFQDTNAVQYAFVKLLAGSAGGVLVVGDDDQSIYGWRGARVENILTFQNDFPGTRVVRLEQNYRSTNGILKAANAVISNNSERLGKNLWTDRGEGESLKVYCAYNEHDEAQFVIERIRRFVDSGQARADCAVLYRSNAQSRVFEEALLSARMPYRVYGGLRFYERQEIKDALAYLKLIQNRNDDASFDRVVNLPARGIGARTLDEVRDEAKREGTGLWHAAGTLLARKSLASRAALALEGFLKLIEALDASVSGLPLAEQVDHVIQGSGLLDMYAKDKGDRGEARTENLGELINAARGFDPDQALGGAPPMDSAAVDAPALSELSTFLAHAALEAGEGQAAEWEDCVQLMTLHSVKGLEFPLVFMTGMEDGLFPHQRSIDDGRGLEEERRLCYVGMTRAMQQLYLTYAEQRRLYGSDAFGAPSRFLREVPPELIEEIRPRVQVARPMYAAPHSVTPALAGSSLYEPPAIKLGARVRHAVFGEGVVLNSEGQGPQARVQVNFERAGSKWLMLQFAKLEVLG